MKSNPSWVFSTALPTLFCRVSESGKSYADALKEAQDLGFAEADPTADVDGFDVAYKLSVLSALGFGHFVKPDTIYKEGIRNITEEDMALAKEFGYRIKLRALLPEAEAMAARGFDVRVHPTLRAVRSSFGFSFRFEQWNSLYAVTLSDN